MMDIHRPFPPRRTIEDLCCVGGQRPPHAPPLPPDQTPNLESIQKVYDTAFAAGLDHFVESGPSRWYASQGFNHLVSDRDLLGQFLLYLTIVSNNANPMQPDSALVAGQEARVTWALLNMIMRPAHDGNEEAERIARRVKAVEALLTGEPSLVVQSSMSDFIHQEDGASDTNPEPVVKLEPSTVWEKQLNRRSEDFWRNIEKFAESPRQYPPYNRNQNPQDPGHPISQSRLILDGLENRDLIYSMMLLSTSNGQENEITSRPGTSQGPNSGTHNTLHHHQQQLALARRFLDNEAGGKGTSLVFSVIAGMASRAFQRD